jgi:diguanylate cyclase (GGDEF)-like protein/PAS domain S-box-containing protein
VKKGIEPMKNETKSKNDLIEEVSILRIRVAELEKLEENWKQGSNDIAERAGHYFTLVDQPNDAIFVIFDRKLEFINQRFEDIFGITSDEAYSPHFDFMSLVAPESRSIFLKYIERGTRGKLASQQFEFSALTKEGRKIECETTILFIPYKWGVAIHGIFRNITIRKRIDEELQRQRSDLQIVLNSIPTSVYYTDKNNKFIQINEAFARSLGLTTDAILGKTIAELFPNLPAQHVQHYHEDNNEVIAMDHAKRGIIQIFPSARGHRWIQTDKMPFRDETGSIVGVISLSIDISDFRKTEEKLWYLSFHDVLTGLYNRAYFEEELLRHERGRLYPISIVVITIDNLIEINHDNGIEAGNDLLKRTAHGLRGFRIEDIVARVGGNKFAAIMPLADESTGEKAIARLKNAFSTQASEENAPPLLLSLGVATGDKGCRLSDVMKTAEEHRKSSVGGV